MSSIHMGPPVGNEQSHGRVPITRTRSAEMCGNVNVNIPACASPTRKKLILCFDGTGNKFKGNAGDTNILKIFRMLDRSGGEQCKHLRLERE